MTRWRWTFVLGMLAFACTIAFAAIPGLAACGGPPAAGGPILAFELVRTPAEVAALFGAEPCRARFVAAQRIGLVVDALGFIPIYSAFLIAALFAAGGTRRRIVLVGAALVLVAALSDEIEGVLLWTILGDLPGRQGVIDPLIVAVRLKFALLALATALVGALLLLARRPVALLLGAVAALFGLLALYALAVDPANRMTGAFMVAWIALLLAAATGSVRPRLVTGAAS